jgi:hypothetical protein
MSPQSTTQHTAPRCCPAVGLPAKALIGRPEHPGRSLEKPQLSSFPTLRQAPITNSINATNLLFPSSNPSASSHARPLYPDSAVSRRGTRFRIRCGSWHTSLGNRSNDVASLPPHRMTSETASARLGMGFFLVKGQASAGRGVRC